MRRCTPTREQGPHCDHDHLGETAYPVKLSLLGTRLPLLLLATIGVACYLTAEDPEGPTASVRGVLECSARIDTMAFARDGTMVAISDTAGMVQLWHPETGRRQVLLGGNRPMRHVSHSHQTGATLAVGDANSNVSIWDVASGAIRWSVSETLRQAAGSGVLSGWCDPGLGRQRPARLSLGYGHSSLESTPRRPYRNGDGDRVCTRRPDCGLG